KLSAQINLMPMGDQPREDVLLNYVIKDYEGNILFKESETVLAENQVNFKKEFDVQSLPPGKYVLGLEMVYSSGIATSSSHFEISDKSSVFSSGMNVYFIVGGVIVLAILIILIIFAVRGPKKIISTKSKR
ncbi:MAG: hypothetical protein KKE50_07120, partial [Nanoarchaeota archaeon]|nr:hypothetical protein [Nanoarchaeota archaeon]